MTGMPSVLMIAYYFPPMGGDGVQRTLKFTRSLPSYKWQPYILTVRSSARLRDQSLMDEVPEDLPIIRTSNLRLPHWLPWRLRNLITRWLFVVDEQVGWLPFAISAGLKVINSNNIKVIYSTSTPYTAHLIARQLHGKTHIPWVADFRDPWINNPFITFPTKFHRKITENIERTVFSQAERLILNTDVSREFYMQKYSDLPPAKFNTITNGYDHEDIIPSSSETRTSLAFTIVHFGSLYQTARSSKYFLQALRKVIQSGSIAPEKIRIIFVGNTDKKTHEYLKQYHLDQSVELLGYLPHRQGIKYLFKADLLLLFPYYGPGAELSIPAKLYEYLASRKPILCLADPGACGDLVLNSRAGSVVPAMEVDKIADELVRLFHQWKKGELRTNPNMDLINSYERRELTAQLANLFNNLVR
jgi:glycosyltransferase involved in cell wall biosynthesis